MSEGEKTNIHKTLSLVLAGALAGVLICWFLFGRNGSGSASDSTTTSDTVTHYVILKDTSTHSHTIEKHFLTSQPINYYNMEYHTDTAAVIRDYFTKKYLKVTDGDSLVKIDVYDTLHKNNVLYRKINWKFLKPYEVDKTTTITTTVTTNKYPFGIYAGPRIEVNPITKQVPVASIDVDLVTRRVSAGTGYDFLNKAVSGKVTFKIFGK